MRKAYHNQLCTHYFEKLTVRRGHPACDCSGTGVDGVLAQALPVIGSAAGTFSEDQEASSASS